MSTALRGGVPARLLLRYGVARFARTPSLRSNRAGKE
jgi:hypothetical protein